MAECILHIGMHKTGSTSIQNSLDGFSNASFRYANLDHTPNHSFAIQSLFGAKGQSHFFLRAKVKTTSEVQKDVQRCASMFTQAIERRDGRHLIISGEGISNMSEQALLRLKETIDPHFDRIRVVGYVRPPAAYMSSMFQQKLKNGIPTFEADRLYRSYRGTFAKFDRVFGRQHVHLWKFDPVSFPESCVVSDFCQRIGIVLTPTRIVRVNDSYSRQVLGLLYVYRSHAEQMGFAPLYAWEANRLSKALNALGNSRFRLAPTLLQPILTNQHADIRWMEERLGQSLHEELGATSADDVATSKNLLAFGVTAAHGLIALLGDKTPPGIAARNCQEVAQLFHAFRCSQQNSQTSWISKWTMMLKNWRKPQKLC